MIGSDELIIDNFAGGGGASQAIEQALSRPVDYAINHDPEAIAMHAANHPDTIHRCENVWSVDIRQLVAGRKVGLAWFSPDCKHFSKAKGGKPVEKKIRGLAWVVLKWARLARPRVIILENVEEFQDWGPLVGSKPCPRRKGVTFKRWVAQLRNLGYAVDWKELRACDYGAPTIRKRLFVVARCDGESIVWPNRTHGPGRLPYRTAADCIDWSIPCPSIFLTREESRRIGVNRPLADNTLRRIARGVKRYVIDAAEPFIVPIANYDGTDRTHSIREPLRTITAHPKGGSMAVVMPFLGTYYGANREGGDRIASIGEPLRTQSTENRHALVAAFLAQHNGGPHNHGGTGRSAGDPVSTITARGTQQQLVTAFLSRQFGQSVGSSMEDPIGTVTAGGGGKSALVVANLMTNTTGHPGAAAMSPLPTVTTGNHHALITSHVMKMRGTNVGSDAGEPLHTVSAQGNHQAEVRAFLLKCADQDPHLEDPLHTVTTKHRFGIVMVHGEWYEIVDIGMRMLTPRELFRAQGFPDSYIIDGGRDVGSTQRSLDGGEWIRLTKEAQVRMCGNSVSPPPAESVIRAQFGLLRKEAVA